MSGYRSRVTKPTVFLWMLIVLVDAGWVATSSVPALVVAVAVGVVAAVALLRRSGMLGRQLIAARQPIPVSRSAARTPPRRRTGRNS